MFAQLRFGLIVMDQTVFKDPSSMKCYNVISSVAAQPTPGQHSNVRRRREVEPPKPKVLGLPSGQSNVYESLAT